MSTWDKYERDGKIAVLVSPGFGADWSTWVSDSEQACMDRRFVELALGERKGTIDELSKEIWGPDNHEYTGGWEDIEVEWLSKGQRFEISEYDGSESLRCLDPETWFVA